MSWRHKGPLRLRRTPVWTIGSWHIATDGAAVRPANKGEARHFLAHAVYVHRQGTESTNHSVPKAFATVRGLSSPLCLCNHIALHEINHRRDRVSPNSLAGMSRCGSSILSARSQIKRGMVMPSALAVFILMTN